MSTSTALKVAIALLMTVSIIELSFISSMVAWVHRSAAYSTFTVNYQGSTFELVGMPKGGLVDQGHASNGAAGTAFIPIGLGGILALWLSSKPKFRSNRLHVFYYNFWVVVSVLGCVYTLASLAYVFALTNAHRGQTIDLTVASALHGTLNERRYPLDKWTPQNWFAAVLKLDLASSSVRSDIENHFRVMRGWQYNLIPMFLVQLVATVLIVQDWSKKRAAPEAGEKSAFMGHSLQNDSLEEIPRAH